MSVLGLGRQACRRISTLVDRHLNVAVGYVYGQCRLPDRATETHTSLTFSQASLWLGSYSQVLSTYYVLSVTRNGALPSRALLKESWLELM